MVAEATRRRRAGDWAGACAAARVDVRFELRDVRNRYGAELSERVEEALHHLVPDLVRWHLPRQWIVDDGLLQPNLRIPLARYGPVALWIRTPSHLTRPQGVELQIGDLEFAPSLVDNWVDTRDLWDSRFTGGLRLRVNGGHAALTEQVIALQEEERFEEAWAAGGIPLSFVDPDDQSPVRLERWYNPSDLFALVPALRSQLSTRSAGTVALARPTGYRALHVVLTVTDEGITGALERYNRTEPRPFVPRSWWHRLPEMELLRLGRLEPAGLHPLVRASLLPDYDGDPEEYRPLGPLQTESVPVRCRGVWHQVGWHGGRVQALDHTEEEARREGVMRSLGGEVPRCFTVAESWRRGEALPRPLRHLRRHGLLALRHGDAAEFNRLLDLGVDPAGIRDRWDRDPLHYMAHVESIPLLHRLLAAGLDINRRDGQGRTPLLWALFDGASATLVNAMLDAGADPTIADGTGDTGLHLLRSREAPAFLPRLLAAGLDLEARDEYGRTPLLTQVISEAPAEAIHALFTAGADPTARDEYSEQSIADFARYHRRTDLDFLPTSEESDGDD
jgi:hypothetical protein